MATTSTFSSLMQKVNDFNEEVKNTLDNPNERAKYRVSKSWSREGKAYKVSAKTGHVTKAQKSYSILDVGLDNTIGVKSGEYVFWLSVATDGTNRLTPIRKYSDSAKADQDSIDRELRNIISEQAFLTARGLLKCNVSKLMEKYSTVMEKRLEEKQKAWAERA